VVLNKRSGRAVVIFELPVRWENCENAAGSPQYGTWTPAGRGGQGVPAAVRHLLLLDCWTRAGAKRKHGVSLSRISVLRELTKGHITPLSGSDRGESVDG